MGRLVLGVDGGNTKTIALVARTDGTIVGAGRGGTGDIYNAASAQAAVAEIRRAIDEAIRSSAVDPAGICAAGFSLAGADYPEDVAFYLEALAHAIPEGAPRRVVNDAIGALRAGTVDGVGVSVACGSGDAVGACGRDGRLWHASFWLQPGGGAEELGRAAFRAVVRSEVGWPPTSMTPAALRRFGAHDVPELLHGFTRRGAARSWRDLKQLAPVLFDAAAHGDAVASGLVERYADRLGRYASTAASRVGLDGSRFPLVFAGGLLRHRVIGERLIARVAAAVPDADPVRARFEPAVGAVFLALDLVGESADEELVARSCPGPELFAT